MRHISGPSLGGRGAAVFAAALAVAGASEALAQQPPPAPSAPMSGLYNNAGATRYSTPDGSVRFVLDRSGGRRGALVQFDGDPEVHVLRPAMAAGGGEIYQTEDGDVMLRVTAHGGIIVYTRSVRTGLPVSEVSRVAPLAPEAMQFAEMERRFRALQTRARRRVGQTITFTVPAQVTPDAAGVILDAAERAAEGLAAAPMTNVRRVIISVGRRPAVAKRGDVLYIQVAPQLGYAGRPSSNTIRNVVTGAVQGPEQ